MIDFLVIWSAIGFFAFIIVSLHDFFKYGHGWQKGDLYLLVMSIIAGGYGFLLMIRMFYGWYGSSGIDDDWNDGEDEDDTI